MTDQTRVDRTPWALLGVSVSLLLGGMVGAAACRVITPHAAVTYYVAPSGDDARPCGTAQAIGTPRRTVTAGIACLTAGDTLLVRAGTYDETITFLPSGTSWDAKVRIAAYPGESVWLTPTADRNGAHAIVWLDCACHFIEVDAINMDGRPAKVNPWSISTNNGQDPHHIRIQHAELIAGAIGSAGAVNFGEHSKIGATGGNEAIDLKIHGGGTSGLCGYLCASVGVYIKGPNNLVEHCDIWDTAGIGIQIYNADGDAPDHNIIRNNRIHDITRLGDPGEAWGILVSQGDGNEVYNNVVYGVAVGNNSGDGGIALAGTHTKAWHNTSYHNLHSGLVVGAGVNAAEITNTITYGNGGADFLDQGTGTVQSHNLIGVDPQFVNAGAGDLHLQAGSPGINTGTPVATVTTDLEGTARPQGPAPDIGAYELGAAPPPSVVTGWDVAVWAAAPPTPTAPAAMAHLLHSAATCALAPLAAPGPVTNPTEARVTDPDRAGQQCALPISALVQSVPAGSGYTVSVRATSATAVSGVSAPSNPFTRTALPAPAAPTVH